MFPLLRTFATGSGEMKIERGKIHGFSRIRRVLVPKICVNPVWTVCKRPDVISASQEV
jgi:hypothetical protein